jgi:hypothetical protein
MKAKNRAVHAEFAAETRFEITPHSPAPFRSTQENKLEGLKDQLLRATLARTVSPELAGELHFVAEKAAALAWVTPYPLLVFPGLFEEQAEAVLNHAEEPNRGEGKWSHFPSPLLCQG